MITDRLFASRLPGQYCVKGPLTSATRGADPVDRHFVGEIDHDPVAWVGTRPSDLKSLLDEAAVPADSVDPDDAEELRTAVPDILVAVRRLLELACQPWVPSAEYGPEGLRAGWR
jgi:hypothetical protein